jgi:trans-2,3-dihydro-3-hydroxyanthranilate isomerase
MSSSHAYILADVFTDRMFGGNPLAVFPEGDAIPAEFMPWIARELNLSEVVFVHPPGNPTHTRRLRIFTPGVEVPFAGHPTVGTACVLAATGLVPMKGPHITMYLEEGVGPILVEVTRVDERLRARFTVPRSPDYGPAPPSNNILSRLLGIDEKDILTGRLRPGSVSCGVPFLFIPVRDRRVLGQARLDLSVWREHVAPSWAPQVYPFTLDVELQGSSLRSRMFAPAMGIAEDPATGAAAAALAGYLCGADESKDSAPLWRIEQGFDMGRPSLIDLEAEKRNGKVVAIRVGGESVLVGEGTLRLPRSLRRE